MKKHHGMRPQDIVILLKVSLQNDDQWLIKDLAAELSISQSEMSESLHRSAFGGLIAQDKKTLMQSNLLDFLLYGLRYVFPQKAGPLSRGVPTAHSAMPLKQHIVSDTQYVWPHPAGEIVGMSIEPLYATVPMVCLQDKPLHRLLALVDALRVGRKREQALATDYLRQLLSNASQLY